MTKRGKAFHSTGKSALHCSNARPTSKPFGVLCFKAGALIPLERFLFGHPASSPDMQVICVTSGPGPMGLLIGNILVPASPQVNCHLVGARLLLTYEIQHDL